MIEDHLPGAHANAQTSDARRPTDHARGSILAEEDEEFIDDIVGGITGVADDIKEWVEKATKEADDWLGGALDDATKWLDGAKGDADAWVQDAKDDAGGWLDSAVSDADDWFDDAKNDVDNWFKGAASTADGWFNKVKGDAESWLENQIAEAVEKIKAELDKAVTDVSNEATKAIDSIADGITEAVGEVEDLATDAVNTVGSEVEKAIDTVDQASKAALDEFLATVEAAYDTTDQFFDDAGRMIGRTIEQVATDAHDYASKAVNDVNDDITDAWKDLEGEFEDLGGEIEKFYVENLKEFGEDLGQFFTDLGPWILNGLNGMMNRDELQKIFFYYGASYVVFAVIFGINNMYMLVHHGIWTLKFAHEYGTPAADFAIRYGMDEYKAYAKKLKGGKFQEQLSAVDDATEWQSDKNSGKTANAGQHKLDEKKCLVNSCNHLSKVGERSIEDEYFNQLKGKGGDLKDCGNKLDDFNKIMMIVADALPDPSPGNMDWSDAIELATAAYKLGKTQIDGSGLDPEMIAAFENHLWN